MDYVGHFVTIKAHCPTTSPKTSRVARFPSSQAVVDDGLAGRTPGSKKARCETPVTKPREGQGYGTLAKRERRKDGSAPSLRG